MAGISPEGAIRGPTVRNYFWWCFAGRGKGTRTGPGPFAQGGPVVNLCGAQNNQAVFAMTSANPKVGLSHANKRAPHNGVATRMWDRPGRWHGRAMAWQGAGPYVTHPVKWGFEGGLVSSPGGPLKRACHDKAGLRCHGGLVTLPRHWPAPLIADCVACPVVRGLSPARLLSHCSLLPASRPRRFCPRT